MRHHDRNAILCQHCNTVSPATKDNEGKPMTEIEEPYMALVVCPECGAISALQYADGQIEVRLLDEDQLTHMPKDMRHQVINTAMPIVFKWVLANSTHPMAKHMQMTMCKSLAPNKPGQS